MATTTIPPDDEDPEERVRRFLAACQRKAGKIAIATDKLRERSEAALGDISQQADDLSAMIGAVLHNPDLITAMAGTLDRLGRRMRELESAEMILRARLREGAREVQFSPRSGTATGEREEVWVDGHAVKLPAKPAALLWALAQNEGEKADDNLVGWKRKGRVVELIAERSGLHVKERALNSLIHRLREELDSIGYRKFVQTCPGRLRFAVRRTGAS